MIFYFTNTQLNGSGALGSTKKSKAKELETEVVL